MYTICFLQSLHSTESLDLLARAASLMLEDSEPAGRDDASHAPLPPPPGFQLAFGSRSNRHVPEGPTATTQATTRTNLTTIDEKEDGALFCSERLDDPLPEGTLPFNVFPRWYSAPGGRASRGSVVVPLRSHVMLGSTRQLHAQTLDSALVQVRVGLECLLRTPLALLLPSPLSVCPQQQQHI